MGVVGAGGLDIFGIVLYPPCSVPLVPGLLFGDIGLPSDELSGQGLVVLIVILGLLLSFGGSGSVCSFCSGRGISSVLRSRNSRSYAVPTLPSFSHRSCASLFACVGSIC